MAYEEPGYFKQCVHILKWWIKELFRKKSPRRELIYEIEREKRKSEKLEAKNDALEELLAQERDKTRDLRKENARLTATASARRSSMVPHCRACPNIQKREPAVGKIVCTCSQNPGAVISVMEGRTSPKWCPLREGKKEAENEE